jgi:hypothetical protein
MRAAITLLLIVAGSPQAADPVLTIAAVTIVIPPTAEISRDLVAHSSFE